MSEYLSRGFQPLKVGDYALTTHAGKWWICKVKVVEGSEQYKIALKEELSSEKEAMTLARHKNLRILK